MLTTILRFERKRVPLPARCFVYSVDVVVMIVLLSSVAGSRGPSEPCHNCRLNSSLTTRIPCPTNGNGERYPPLRRVPYNLIASQATLREFWVTKCQLTIGIMALRVLPSTFGRLITRDTRPTTASIPRDCRRYVSTAEAASRKEASEDLQDLESHSSF